MDSKPACTKYYFKCKNIFLRCIAGAPLNADVKYDLIIVDQNGSQLIKKENLIAKGGGPDSQTLTFPAKETYQIQVNIKGLIKPGQATDETRNGIARGYVIVPEFPPAAGGLILIGGLFVAAALVVLRLRTIKR